MVIKNLFHHFSPSLKYRFMIVILLWNATQVWPGKLLSEIAEISLFTKHKNYQKDHELVKQEFIVEPINHYQKVRAVLRLKN